MYGLDCKITQSQWNEAVAIVERLEEQERRQREELRMQGHNGGRMEWIKRDHAIGELIFFMPGSVYTNGL